MRVIGLGAGGHAKVVLDALLAAGVEVVGLLDARGDLRGTSVLGIPILGGDEMLDDLRAQGVTHAFIGVGSTRDVSPRRRLYELIVARGLEPLTVVHPRAIVSADARLGRGGTILAGAIVNPGVSVGDNVIVNTGAIVEHDCVLGDHVHVATGARLAGGVTVEACAHVGIGASVRQGVRIGRDAVVGAGSVVIDDVPAGATVVGVPARPIGR